MYGQLNYSFTKKLDLIGGLRYDYENKKLNVQGEYQKMAKLLLLRIPDTSAKLSILMLFHQSSV